MNARQNITHPSRELRAEAAAWLAKLHGPERSEELESDFRSWLGASRENARAFEHMTEIWDSLGSVNIGGLARPEPPRAVASRSGARAAPRLVRWGAIAAAAAIAGVVGFQFLAAERYTTDIGEQRIVTLSDGTRLSINSGTRVDVDYGDSTRRIQLRRGEAYFEVAKDVQRPFVVTAGPRTVTALGTAFAIRHEREVTSITLVEGKVAVDGEPVPVDAIGPAEAEAHRATILAPGQRLTYAGVDAPKIDVPRPGTTAAWRRGEVILDDTPLRAAVDEMNRYERQRLVLDGPDVVDLPVSGIYRTGDSEGFARAVASVYGLSVIVEGKDIHLRRH